MKNENPKRKRAPPQRRRPFQYFNDLRPRGEGKRCGGGGGVACWTDIDRYIHEACVSVVNFILFDLILNEKAANDAGRISFIVILEPDRAAEREREWERERKSGT